MKYIWFYISYFLHSIKQHTSSHSIKRTDTPHSWWCGWVALSDLLGGKLFPTLALLHSKREITQNIIFKILMCTCAAQKKVFFWWEFFAINIPRFTKLMSIINQLDGLPRCLFSDIDNYFPLTHRNNISKLEWELQLLFPKANTHSYSRIGTRSELSPLPKLTWISSTQMPWCLR